MAPKQIVFAACKEEAGCTVASNNYASTVRFKDRLIHGTQQNAEFTGRQFVSNRVCHASTITVF